jgi:hypothetical protein
MTKKPPKKGLSESEAEYRHEDEAFTEAELDAWIERNKDALNASIEKAHQEYLRGEYYTIEETMARVMAAIERAAKKP